MAKKIKKKKVVKKKPKKKITKKVLPKPKKKLKAKVSPKPIPESASAPKVEGPVTVPTGIIGIVDGAVVVTAPPDQPLEAVGEVSPEVWRHDIISCGSCSEGHCVRFTSTNGIVPPSNFTFYCPTTNQRVVVSIAAWELSSTNETLRCVNIQP